MLEKLKALSTQAKIAIVAGITAVTTLGVGVAVMQPWNRGVEPPTEPDDQMQQGTVEPAAPAEKGLSVKANGEEVPCTLYEGTGWSVYVPENWETVGAVGLNGALFRAADGAEMEVGFQPVDGNTGAFFSLAAVDGTDRQLQFCDGSGEGSPVLMGRAPKSQWDRYGKLFLALAKTMTVGTQSPFAGSYVIPWEPDWQVADGKTVLFIGKDGIILDSMVQTAVENDMRSWPAEDRTVYTGQYRVNGIDWAASYTGLTDGYIDVFKARVQYRMAEGAQAPAGVNVVDGWASLPDSLYLAINHDGGDVSKTQTVVTQEPVDWVAFAELLK